MSEWVSVTDELPSPNLKVLVCRVGKTSYQPFFAIRKNRPTQPWDYIDGDPCRVSITHWMPIPDMPEQK